MNEEHRGRLIIHQYHKNGGRTTLDCFLDAHIYITMGITDRLFFKPKIRIEKLEIGGLVLEDKGRKK